MKHSSQAGFGALAFLLGIVALLAIGSAVVTFQAQEDRQVIDKQIQKAQIAQQADTIRALVRQCAANMTKLGVTAAGGSQPFNKYPDCVVSPNISSQANSTCVIAPTMVTASLENLYCAANSRYVFDAQQSAFNVTPVAGFGKWQYVKEAGVGIYIQIQPASGNASFADVVRDVKARFAPNELGLETLSSTTPQYIRIYVYRDTFDNLGITGQGGGGTGGDGTQTIPGAPVDP